MKIDIAQARMIFQATPFLDRIKEVRKMLVLCLYYTTKSKEHSLLINVVVSSKNLLKEKVINATQNTTDKSKEKNRKYIP